MQTVYQLVTLVWLALVSVQVAAQEATYTFDIAPQPLAQALDKLVDQTGLEPFYSKEIIEGIQGKGVQGTYTLREALERMLAGTGLTYSFTGDKAVAIKAAAVTELPTIEVRDETETAYQVNSTSAATRTNTPLENIPLSIVVIPEKLIEDQDSSSLSEVLKNVSNVVAFDQRDISTATDFRIRGFSSGVIVDGVSMPGYFSNQEPVINMQKVDVVKGPTGSLFAGSQTVGSRNLGGVIAITSKAPDNVTRHETGFRIGNYGLKAGYLDLNQPVNSELGVRLVAELESRKSETDRISSRNIFVAPSLSWRPSEDSLVLLRVRHVDYDYYNFYGLPSEGTVFPGTGFPSLIPAGGEIPRNRIFTAESVPESNVSLTGINLQIDHSISEVWSLAITLARNYASVDSQDLYPWNFLGFGDVYPSILWADMVSTSMVPTVTAKFSMGEFTHTIVSGIQFDNTSDDGYIVTDLFAGTIPDYIDPIYPDWVKPVIPDSPDQRNSYQTEAFFIQDQLDMGRLHIQAGLNHSRIKVEDINISPFFNFNNISKTSRTSPRIGATFDVVSGISFFAGYGDGIKVPITANYAEPPKPEQAEQVEAGIKLGKNGLNATLAYFDLTRKNVTANDGFVAVQVGEQQSHGLDFDMNWSITDELTWLAGYSKQKATIVENARDINIGKRLFAVPDETIRLSARYDIQAGSLSGLGVGLGLQYRSSLPGDSANSYFTPAATLFDTQISYVTGPFRIGMYITNLTDKKYFVPSTSQGFVYPAPRRQVSLNTSVSF